MAKSLNTPASLSDADEVTIQRQIAINTDVDAAEATDAELAQAKPFAAARTELADSIRRARGRPARDKPRQHVSLRLDADVLDNLKASGKGWQSRLSYELEMMTPNGTAIRQINIMARRNGRGIPTAWWHEQLDRFTARFETGLRFPDPTFESEELATLNRYCDQAGIMSLKELEAGRMTG